MARISLGRGEFDGGGRTAAHHQNLDHGWATARIGRKHVKAKADSFSNPAVLIRAGPY